MAVRTIAAGGGNWNATATWMEGIVPIAGDTVFAAVTSGQLTVNVASACTSINFTNYTNTLTMNATLSVGGSVTLVAAMTITGTGILSITAAATMTSNGKTWTGALTLFGGSHSFGDNWTVTGLLTTTTNTTLNNNSITCNGGIRVNGGTTVGSCIIKLGGGTWSARSITSAIRNPFQFVGDCTVSGQVAFYNNTMTWVSGAITTTGSQLFIQAAATTLNTSGMTWFNVRFTSAVTHTLTSNLNLSSNLVLGSTTGTTTINGNTINVGNGITMGGTTTIITGTTNIKITGGTIAGISTTQLRNNLEIAGDVTISNSADFRYNTGTLTYTSGKVTTTGSTLLIALATTLINMDKIAWNIVNVTAGVTLTMNKFFSGSPKQKTTMRSVTSGTAYTITFQDTFEKTAKFVKVSDCSLTRKGQLLMLTPNSDKGGNSGIRYINQSPNGIAKNSPSVVDPITYPSFGLVADPCFISL